MYYFEGIKEFKTLVGNLENDLQELIGDTKIMFAMKKGTSIGNLLLKNKILCAEPSPSNENQKCNEPGCRQCPLVNIQQKLTINNKSISIPIPLIAKQGM